MTINNIYISDKGIDLLIKKGVIENAEELYDDEKLNIALNYFRKNILH